MNCSPQTSLSLALQILHWLPSISWDLSYHMGIPTMFAYGSELYELQTWGATGDGRFHLDNHAQATNLLSHKLAHIHGGAGSDRASPSKVASHTSSAASHSSTASPARSHSRTPPHGTSLVRSCFVSVSSASSHTAVLRSPAGSGGKGHEDNKSTSQDGDGTNDESTAGSDDEALEMINTKPVRVLTLQTPAAMLRKPRGLELKQKGQPPRAAKVPQNPMVRCQSMQLHH